MTLITLYSRPDCHLCDEALVLLERMQAELGFELAERDISGDEALERAYFERIPVIALDGEVLFEFFVEESILRDRLATD